MFGSTKAVITINSQSDMDVTEEPSKPPSRSELHSAINTLPLHSVLVDQNCVEKIRKLTSIIE